MRCLCPVIYSHFVYPCHTICHTSCHTPCYTLPYPYPAKHSVVPCHTHTLSYPAIHPVKPCHTHTPSYPATHPAIHIAPPCHTLSYPAALSHTRRAQPYTLLHTLPYLIIWGAVQDCTRFRGKAHEWMTEYHYHCIALCKADLVR